MGGMRRTPYPAVLLSTPQYSSVLLSTPQYSSVLLSTPQNATFCGPFSFSICRASSGVATESDSSSRMRRIFFT